MPQSSSSGNGYNVTSSGSNSQDLPITLSLIMTQDTDSKVQGNHYCSRDYTPSTGGSQANSNTYHYSNTDGSYYYSNPNGSTYYNNGSGDSSYTAPGGKK